MNWIMIGNANKINQLDSVLFQVFFRYLIAFKFVHSISFAQKKRYMENIVKGKTINGLHVHITYNHCLRQIIEETF